MMVETKGVEMVAISNQRESFADLRCNVCGQVFTVVYNRQDMSDWLSGSEYIQDALHYLTAGERELLLSGVCSTCFDDMFSDSEDLDS